MSFKGEVSISSKDAAEGADHIGPRTSEHGKRKGYPIRCNQSRGPPARNKERPGMLKQLHRRSPLEQKTKVSALRQSQWQDHHLFLPFGASFTKEQLPLVTVQRTSRGRRTTPTQVIDDSAMGSEQPRSNYLSHQSAFSALLSFMRYTQVSKNVLEGEGKGGEDIHLQKLLVRLNSTSNQEVYTHEAKGGEIGGVETIGTRDGDNRSDNQTIRATTTTSFAGDTQSRRASATAKVISIRDEGR